MTDQPASFGEHLTLGVGVAALAGAVLVGAVAGSPIGGLVLALVGASALSGWVKARGRRKPR